jgi:hypothetical protein
LKPTDGVDDGPIVLPGAIELAQTDQFRWKSADELGLLALHDALIGRFDVFVAVGDALFEFVTLGEEVIEALDDLVEDIGAGLLDIFVAKLDQYLGDPTDGPHGVDRIVFPRRNRVAAH